MSFFRLDPRDVVVSSDTVSSTIWSSEVVLLTTFHTSSAQQTLSSGDFYAEVRATNSSTAPVEFSVAYADAKGSGSAPFNAAVTGTSPTAAVYQQIKNLVLGDNEDDFVFGTEASEHFYVLSVDRARYHEKLLPGSFNLRLSGSAGNTLDLTDNSLDVTQETYTEAGRVYQIVSGSNGSGYATNSTTVSGSYGWMLPDIGVVLLNGKALDLAAADGGADLGTNRTTNTNAVKNFIKVVNAIKGGAAFRLNSEETITSNYIFARVRSDEANYSTNPSMISGSSGDLLHEEMIYSPVTYATTVGIYNDNNDLLAVAKLSKPLKKDFTKEALVRIKLDY